MTNETDKPEGAHCGSGSELSGLVISHCRCGGVGLLVVDGDCGFNHVGRAYIECDTCDNVGPFVTNESKFQWSESARIATETAAKVGWNIQER